MGSAAKINDEIMIVILYKLRRILNKFQLLTILDACTNTLEMISESSVRNNNHPMLFSKARSFNMKVPKKISKNLKLKN